MASLRIVPLLGLALAAALSAEGSGAAAEPAANPAAAAACFAQHPPTVVSPYELDQVAGDGSYTSVAGAQLSAMLLVVRVDAMTFVGAVGAWLSGHADVVTAIVAEGDELPAASLALTPTWYAFPHERPVRVAFVCGVVVASVEPR